MLGAEDGQQMLVTEDIPKILEVARRDAQDMKRRGVF
jgi:hypothetical protein